ncbi:MULTISPECIES: LutC/YkgG family protein [Geobacter]|uniref:LutC/YkgG family protein n=1 Tax=Geobacter TaxID=28231 RepID=UPI002572DA50|nr:lactate utilization protein [Geobacter sulfurreducens]BEH10398.1 lactate utilization protein [Geobacter sulfurreducens subsp. ethanolicus]BET58015.1 lactate utilization protein [Geobacter sp. 60473]HML78360.1 lactate utilization protein [Geobacter sulfurreducens]
MISTFTVAAEAVGATVKHFTDLDDVAGYLQDLTANRLVASSSLSSRLAAMIETITPLPPERLADAEVGISEADAGIAETGSVLLELTAPAQRAATALPLVHAVILRASTIVPTLSALGERLGGLLAEGGSRYLSLITGPSRTADIERVLTIGVHGPKELHILIIEGE